MSIPPFLLLFWLTGLLSLALLGAGGWLIWEWYDNWVRDLPANPRFLVGGLLLLALTLLGRPLLAPWLGRPPQAGEEEPAPLTGGTVHRLPRPDGTELHVEEYGPADAPVLVFTHGWGLSHDEWFYAQRYFGDRFRLLLWDLPGLGQSQAARQHDDDLAHMARDLEAVLSLAKGHPALLCGHSIGGMITLTFCRLFPERLGTQVVGLVLTHTTFTNPVNTAWGARLFRPLQNPVLRPLCFLTSALWPLVWVMNRLGELNGSAHLLNHFLQFGGRETRGQLNFFTSLGQRAHPAVVARGMLAMTRYEAAGVLPALPVPALVVAASSDKATSPEASRFMTTHIPHAREVVLSPAGHLGLIEQHQAWCRAVDDFAKACFQPGV